MLTVGKLFHPPLPISSLLLKPDVTVLYVFRDQHTTNEDNPEAQSIFPTVACITDDLYSYWSQLESVIGHLQSAYATDALSKMLNGPIHPCKVNVSGRCETDGERTAKSRIY